MGPEDCPPAPVQAEALSERAKLTPDSAGRGAACSVDSVVSRGRTAGGEGSPLWLCVTLAGWLARVLLISLLTSLPSLISLRSPYQQICKASTLLISTESKYSNLEFSLFKIKCDFNLPTCVLPSVWHFFLWYLLRKKQHGSM